MYRTTYNIVIYYTIEYTIINYENMQNYYSKNIKLYYALYYI